MSQTHPTIELKAVPKPKKRKLSFRRITPDWDEFAVGETRVLLIGNSQHKQIVTLRSFWRWKQEKPEERKNCKIKTTRMLTGIKVTRLS